MKRLCRLCVPVFMLLLTVSCVAAHKVVVDHVPEPPTPKTMETGKTKPITMGKVVVRLARGEEYGCLQGGLFCKPVNQLVWRGGGQYSLRDDEYAHIFFDETRKFGYNVVGDPDALFQDPNVSQALIQVAAAITDLKINLCAPFSKYRNTANTKGESSIAVEWHIYSVLDRKILYKLNTRGSFEVKDASKNGTADLYYNAFAQAVRGLLADAKFQAIVSGASGVDAGAGAQSRNRDHIEVVVDKKAHPPVSSFKEAKKAVFTVFESGGTGSGFFISPDGYGLTNYHVALESDKIRCVGEDRKPVIATVLNRDAKRDIALIKAESGTFAYLDIDQNKAEIGTDVYAVGSPRGDRYHGSLTKGIVSGYRSLDGKLELQSDAPVTHGNSGGPLVDVRARVLGICAWGEPGTVLNFFIPIFDGLEKINVSVR